MSSNGDVANPSDYKQQVEGILNEVYTDGNDDIGLEWGTPHEDYLKRLTQLIDSEVHKRMEEFIATFPNPAYSEEYVEQEKADLRALIASEGIALLEKLKPVHGRESTSSYGLRVSYEIDATIERLRGEL